MQDTTIDPNTIAILLQIPRREIAVRCGVTCDWLRVIARDPRHQRRVLIATLEVALERTRYHQTVGS